MNRKVFLTMSNQIIGHGSFSRQERMAQALVKKGHTVYWISPPGYNAPNINVIPLSVSKLPNFAFIGLYIKLFITFCKNYKILNSVDSVFTLREYDAICMIALPFLRGTSKFFLSRGDSISIYKINQPDNKTLIEKFKTLSLFAFYPNIQKIVLKFSDLVVVQAPFLLEILKNRHKDIIFQSMILNNDCPNFEMIHHNKQEIKIINLAFISPLFWECKGLGIIVDMVIELNKRGVLYKLHIIGDGPHKERMHEALKGFERPADIIWHGWLNDITHIINSIDLVIVPSLYDSNPNLILEMISYNKPTLASDIAAHKEMLLYEELLFENKNIDHLVDKIMLFQSNFIFRANVLQKLTERKDKLSFDWEAEFTDILELTPKDRTED